VLEEEIVPFTLWWGDRSVKAPDPDAIRIRVHPEANGDYAAVSFYMDIGQRWGEPHAAAADPAMGLRRRLLMEAVHDIRRSRAPPPGPRRTARARGRGPPGEAGDPEQPRPAHARRAAGRPQGAPQSPLRRYLGGLLPGDELPPGGHRRRPRRGVRQLPRPHHV